MDEQTLCDVCGMSPIEGVQFQCSVCPNFNVCGNCENKHKHDKSHLFLQLDKSQLKIKHPKLINRSHMQHEGYYCDLCVTKTSIVGFRYHCMICQIDLCESCEASGVHDYTHARIKYSSSNDAKKKKISTTSSVDNAALSSVSSIDLSEITSPFDVPAGVIKAMLRREDILRLSSETQQAYKEYRLAGRSEEGMEVVVDELQARVVREFGLPADVGLEAIRCAESILEGDEEVNSLSLYRRHNRCIDADLNIGDTAPDVRLVTMSKETVQLLDFVSVEKPLIVITGSYT